MSMRSVKEKSKSQDNPKYNSMILIIIYQWFMRIVSTIFMYFYNDFIGVVYNDFNYFVSMIYRYCINDFHSNFVAMIFFIL